MVVVVRLEVVVLVVLASTRYDDVLAVLPLTEEDPDPAWFAVLTEDAVVLPLLFSVLERLDVPAVKEVPEATVDEMKRSECPITRPSVCVLAEELPLD